MTREEAIKEFEYGIISDEAVNMAIKALEQVPNIDMREIKEIVECDADLETKYNMISNILTAKPHYFEKQEPTLDKIRAEIEQNAYPIVHGVNNHEKGMTLYGILQIIDKYKTESEEKE